jgi:O-antigen/teichoic acid export membrane protein
MTNGAGRAVREAAGRHRYDRGHSVRLPRRQPTADGESTGPTDGVHSHTTAGGLRGTAVQGVGWTVLRSVASRTVGSLVFIVLARLLDPKDFGTVAIASVFVVLLSLLVESGFGEALIQRKDVTPRELDTSFWTNNCIGVGLAGIMAAGAGLVAASFHQPDLAPVLQMLSLVLVFAALSSVPQALLRRQLAFRQIAFRGLAATCAGGAVGVVMALSGFGVWSLVGQMLTNALVGTVVLWLACSWRPGLQVSVAAFVELFRFGANMLGERIAMFISRRSDDFLVGLVLGSVALGLYTGAYRILLIVTEILIWTVEGVAFPLFSRLHGDTARTKRAFCVATQLCSAVAIPAFLTLAVLAPEVTRVTLGGKWTAAIPVMTVLALVGIPHAATYVNKAVVAASGRPNLSFRIAALTAVINVIGFVIVVRFGILAVAASYVVCGYLLVPVSVWSVTRVLDLDVKAYLRLYVAPLTSGLVMLLALLAAKAALHGLLTDLPLFAVLVIVAAGVYLLALYLTDRSLVSTLLSIAKGLIKAPSSSPAQAPPAG